MLVSQRKVDEWFEEHEYPSPTLFAIDMGIAPGELKKVAGSDDIVLMALYRMIGHAESKLYDKVHGPLAVISRIELFLPSLDDDVVIDSADMFVAPDDQAMDG